MAKAKAGRLVAPKSGPTPLEVLVGSEEYRNGFVRELKEHAEDTRRVLRGVAEVLDYAGRQENDNRGVASSALLMGLAEVVQSIARDQEYVERLVQEFDAPPRNVAPAEVVANA